MDKHMNAAEWAPKMSCTHWACWTSRQLST